MKTAHSAPRSWARTRWLWRLIAIISLLLTGIIPQRTLNAQDNDPIISIDENIVEESAPFANLDTSAIETGVLYDKVTPLSNIEAYDGRSGAEGSLSDWEQMYFEINHANLIPGRLPSLDDVEAAAKQQNLQEQTITLAILNYRYNRIAPDAIKNNLLTWQGERLADVPNREASPYEERRVFAAATLEDKTYQGSNVRFVIGKQFYYSNDDSQLQSLEVDFGDGLGYRAAQMEDVFQISYAAPGEKRIKIRMHYPNDTLESVALFDVQALSIPLPHETWPLQAHIHNNIPVSGVAYVYKSNRDEPIDRPIIVMDGIDPLNERNWPILYTVMNQQNFMEDLRSQGFDFIVLDYSDGGNWIQWNAALLVELIKRVNSAKVGTEQLVVIGPSMGGLVARYALLSMESAHVPHNTRLFISFDAPHQGANIPLGDQEWLNFFASKSVEAKKGLMQLNSIASRQMLVYHYQASEKYVLPDQYRVALLNELQKLGNYPSNLRMVAIANGSGAGYRQPYPPPMAQMIRYHYNSFKVDIVGDTWALPSYERQDFTTIFHGIIDIVGPSYRERTVRVKGTLPYDSAPGSARLTNVEIAIGDTGGRGRIEALYWYHSFIPTISALDITTSDLYYNVQASGDSVYDRTPFDKVYYPVKNTGHMEITAEIKKWILSEIMLSPKALGAANDFNVFTLGDLTQVDAQTDGRVAAGGDVHLSNYSVGAHLPNSHGARDDLIAGKRLIFQQGTVAKGNVVSGDQADLTDVAIPNGRYRRDRPIDFAAEGSRLREASSVWSQLAPNGDTAVHPRADSLVEITLTGTDPRLNVFWLTGKDLAVAKIIAINAPPHASVLVNIDGEADQMRTLGFNITGTDRQYVLYNFYQAAKLTLADDRIQGSILAPFAAVDLIGGRINGTLIGGALNGSGVIGNFPFIGALPQPRV